MLDWQLLDDSLRKMEASSRYGETLAQGNIDSSQIQDHECSDFALYSWICLQLAQREPTAEALSALHSGTFSEGFSVFRAEAMGVLLNLSLKHEGEEREGGRDLCIPTMVQLEDRSLSF